jgi:glycosyltransferase involved in cell wall biosynthesis
VTDGRIDVSVVTPSYNMLGYLKRACLSVQDQQGAAFEHIVVDACSTDGTPEWLRSKPRVLPVVEPDRGMYDAVNKGLRLARGEVMAYLNCDEQYLPGTLEFVRHQFEMDPSLDILFGDTLLIRPDGSLISIRKSYRPMWPLIMSSHLYVYSASMFFRRRLVDNGEYFDAQLKGAGDFEFVPRLLRKGYRARHVRHTLAAFTMTGNNHSVTATDDHSADGARLARVTPWWVQRLHIPLQIVRLALKASSGGYMHRGPLAYAVYSADDATARTQFQTRRVSTRWRTS